MSIICKIVDINLMLFEPQATSRWVEVISNARYKLSTFTEKF